MPVGSGRAGSACGLGAHGLETRLYADLHTGGVFGHDFGHNLGDDFSLYVLGHDIDDARTRGAVEFEM